MRANLRPAFLVIAAAAFAASFVLLAPPTWAATFTLHGRALKGTERKPYSGLAVSLHIVHGNEELPGTTETSGADGSFTFSGLTLDPQQSYFISAEYEGAYYTEGPIEPNGSDAAQDLVVYEVGRDQSAVRVTNHHIIVERKPADLSVTEILVFENTGTTAYLGTGLNHAENVGVRLGLPASVKEFQAGMGGDEQSVRVQGRDLASLRPIPRGRARSASPTMYPCRAEWIFPTGSTFPPTSSWF